MSGAKNDQWSEDNLKYRLELIFGKAPRYPMPLEEYLDYLDSADLRVPFSFSSLILVREKYAALKELIFPSSKSPVWALLENEGDETIVFADPLLKGKNALFFCRVTQDEARAKALQAHWAQGWGKHKQGMIVSYNSQNESMIVAVPGNWFAVK